MKVESYMVIGNHLETKVRKVINKVIDKSYHDLKKWWTYDFDTDVFVETETDFNELSQDDFDTLKSDWIYSVVDGLAISACKELDITHTKDMETICEMTREILSKKIDCYYEKEN